MTRANSFCNLKARADLSTSDVFFSCFSELDTIADWEQCLETKVCHVCVSAFFVRITG